MEGSRRKAGDPHDQRTRSTDSPLQASKRSWRDIALRVKERIGEDNVSIIAGGTAFFVLLGLVPGLAALISIYGLVANPADIQAQFASVSHGMPAEARTILEGQMTRIAEADQTAGIAAAVGILLALWGGSAAMKTVINALNIIYHAEEKRGYVRLTLVALGLTLAFVIIGTVAIGAIVALPPLLGYLSLGNAARTAVSLLRWPLLFAVALIGLGVLYRYAPNRESPAWKWVSPGAVVATLLWVIGSALFAFYAQNFGSYNKTYGSLGAIVVLMMWLYISAFAVLLGAEVNAETEHATSSGSDRESPPSRRGNYVADPAGDEK